MQYNICIVLIFWVYIVGVASPHAIVPALSVPQVQTHICTYCTSTRVPACCYSISIRDVPVWSPKCDVHFYMYAMHAMHVCMYCNNGRYGHRLENMLRLAGKAPNDDVNLVLDGFDEVGTSRYLL